MDKVITPNVQAYTLCAARMKTLLEGIDDVAAVKRVSKKLNPMIWIAGHITVSRCNLARALGRPVDHDWGSRFDRDVKVDDPRPFPSVREVLAKCTQVNEVLKHRFDELTDEELSAPAPRDFPFPDKTIHGMISFLAWHEAYHVGQIGFLRQWVTRS